MKVDDVVRLSNLLDIYGSALTDRQRETLNEYLNYDEGLSEIANAKATSRQAVLDLVQRSISRLEELENQLGFYKRLNIILDKMPKICDKYIVDKNLRKQFVKEVGQLILTVED